MSVQNINIDGLGSFHDISSNYGEIVNAEFYSSAVNSGTVVQTATFSDTTSNAGTVAQATFQGSSQNNGTVDTAVFQANAVNSGTVSIAEFSGETVNNGTVGVSAVFTDASVSVGTVQLAVFGGTAVNTGTVANAVFIGSAENQGTVTAVAEFAGTAVNKGSAAQAVFSESASNDVTGTVVEAQFTGSSVNAGTVTLSAAFANSASNTGTVSGNAIFADTTTNDGTVQGDAQIAETATNSGTVAGAVTEYVPPVDTNAAIDAAALAAGTNGQYESSGRWYFNGVYVGGQSTYDNINALPKTFDLMLVGNENKDASIPSSWKEIYTNQAPSNLDDIASKNVLILGSFVGELNCKNAVFFVNPGYGYSFCSNASISASESVIIDGLDFVGAGVLYSSELTTPKLIIQRQGLAWYNTNHIELCYVASNNDYYNNNNNEMADNYSNAIRYNEYEAYTSYLNTFVNSISTVVAAADAWGATNDGQYQSTGRWYLNGSRWDSRWNSTWNTHIADDNNPQSYYKLKDNTNFTNLVNDLFLQNGVPYTGTLSNSNDVANVDYDYSSECTLTLLNGKLNGYYYHVTGHDQRGGSSQYVTTMNITYSNGVAVNMVVHSIVDSQSYGEPNQHIDTTTHYIINGNERYLDYVTTN
jgi:hypothetical protein